MIRRSLLMVAALALVGGVAACGGKGEDSASTKGDKHSGEDSSTSESTEPGEIGDAATAERPTTEAGDDTATTEAAPTGHDVPSGDLGDIGTALDTDYSFTGEGSETFCSKMGDLQAQYATADPNSINLTDLADKMAAIDPPPELANDWAGYIDMQRTLGAADSDADLTDADAAQLAAFTEASAKVSVYLSDVCGL